MYKIGSRLLLPRAAGDVACLSTPSRHPSASTIIIIIVLSSSLLRRLFFFRRSPPHHNVTKRETAKKNKKTKRKKGRVQRGREGERPGAQRPPGGGAAAPAITRVHARVQAWVCVAERDGRTTAFELLGCGRKFARARRLAAMAAWTLARARGVAATCANRALMPPRTPPMPRISAGERRGRPGRSRKTKRHARIRAAPVSGTTVLPAARTRSARPCGAAGAPCSAGLGLGGHCWPRARAAGRHGATARAAAARGARGQRV